MCMQSAIEHYNQVDAASLLCQEINQDDSFNLEYRGPVIMKGKPTPMDCWFLTRASSALNASSSGNGSLDSPQLQPTTPTATSQRLMMGLGHAPVSRTSSASGSGGGAGGGGGSGGAAATGPVVPPDA
ncbi:hypothetical protein AWZ03_001148 [Drosophila navojoa]|uniref:Guanylate cyclase domain-containing protein n=1 Tax=Drosophila navojoa TaxID=7232 RepID=A0A484BU47_DRONA|nr:hypothetical protein AWZ03_001148 [Drosophila navojoa]